MSNPRDIARSLFNHDRSMPSNVSREVEQEYRTLREKENNETWAALRSIGAGSGSAPVAIPGLGGVVVVLILMLVCIVAAGGQFVDYVYRDPAGVTLFVALVLIWVAPPVGLIGLGILIKAFGVDGFAHPYWFLALMLPVAFLLLPLQLVPVNGYVRSKWRNLYVAVLVFAYFTKGQLEFLIPGHTPGIEQNAIAFALGAGAALVGWMVSNLIGQVIGLVFDGEGSSGYGFLEIVYALVGMIIYGAGLIGLAVFTWHQLLDSESIIAYWL